MTHILEGIKTECNGDAIYSQVDIAFPPDKVLRVKDEPHSSPRVSRDVTSHIPHPQISAPLLFTHRLLQSICSTLLCTASACRIGSPLPSSPRLTWKYRENIRFWITHNNLWDLTEQDVLRVSDKNYI